VNYYYTFIKDNEYITISGNGEDPHNLEDLVWDSSRGASNVLDQLESVDGVYTPTAGFVSVNDYKNDIYIQGAKFDTLYKHGWRFGDSNVPHVEKSEDMKIVKNAVEIDLHKLMSRVGLTRKKVLVKKPGMAPFWSTRWVQEGADIREVMENLGYEVVAEDKPEEKPKLTLKELVQSAYDTGKAAFEAGLDSRGMMDPKLVELLDQSSDEVKDSLKIREGWAKGWQAANIAAPVPGVFDEEPKPEPKVPVFELLLSADTTGSAAFLRGAERSARGDEEFMNVVSQSVGDDKAFNYLERAWLAGWDRESNKKFKDQPDNFDTMPDVEPEPEKPTRGSQKDRPIYERDIPLSERISGTVNVSGVGKVPGILVDDIQIGDRLRFTEGVFTVKSAWSSKGARVGLKGKSRLLVFEETDNNGKNLSLKKQKRSMVGVVTGAISESIPKTTTLPKPEKKVVKPEPEPEVVTSVPSTGRAKSVPQAVAIIHDRFIETPETMSSFFSYGVNLDGLKLEHLNSIIDGFDRTLNKYDVRLNYVGWNKRKQSCTAVYQRFAGSHAGISFQKTATKGVKNKQKKTLTNFLVHKSEDIEKWNRYLTYPESYPGAHENIHNRIARLEVCDRWTVDSSTDDPLAVTAAHEANHAIYYTHSLKNTWEQNMKIYVGDKMQHDVKCASVSEYGMSSMTELFAEVGAAVAFDVEIDPHVKQAYLDTVGSIK